MSDTLLYAVVDRNGFVLDTWESPFGPRQEKTRRRGELRVRRTPGATGWVTMEEPCCTGDRLALDEYGGATVANKATLQTYSAYFFRLGVFIAEAEDANEHPLARTLDHVRMLYSVGKIGTAEELLKGPADEVREEIEAAGG